MFTGKILTQLINILLSIVQFFLILRFMLKLLGANPNAGFVSWMYATSAPLLEPFAGMFPSPVLDGRYVFEFSTLFAIVLYYFVAWLLIELIEFVEGWGQRRDSLHKP